MRRAFKILDKNTLVLVALDVYIKKTKKAWGTYKCYRVYHFVPFIDVHQPTDYYKRKKWMWKNKANWKQYKESLKKKTDIKMPGGYNEITRNDSNWFHHTISMTRIRFFDKKGCRKNKPGKYPFKELK